MTKTELKQQIILRVQETNNALLLEELGRILALEVSEESVYQLGVAQLNEVKEAREQIVRGHFKLNDEANSEIDQWLSK